MADSNVERSPQPPKKKRLKIAVACDECRLRKVKCDGVRPTCCICKKRKDKATCTYTDRKNSKPVNGGLFSSPDRSPLRHGSLVHGATSQLNYNTEQFQPSVNAPSYSQQLWSSHVLPNNEAYGVQGRPSNAGDQAADPEPGIATVENARTSESVTSVPRKNVRSNETVDPMTGPADSFPQSSFWSSSANSFTSQIRAAIDAKIFQPNSISPEAESSRTPLFGPNAAAEARTNNVSNIDYALPPRRTANNLLAVYWDLIDPLYPFIDRKRFEEMYECIWSGETAYFDERVLLCTLNVMFALGSQLAVFIKPAERASSADVYFQRAQELLPLSLWDHVSFQLIQCLLLLGQYLQSTNSGHHCWMVIGHAIRVAQDLGLHQFESDAQVHTPRERQLVRRVWHGCVLMDQLLCMTLGRPTTTRSLAAAVPLPEGVDDEFILPYSSEAAQQPGNTPSKMMFYVKSLQLYGIVSSILSALYAGEPNKKAENNQEQSSPASSVAPDIGVVLHLDQELMEWARGLPSYLRISHPDSLEKSVFQRQSIICRLRFLHARIILFRPVVAQYCLPQSASADSGTVLDESLAQRLHFQCSSLCLRAAHDVIGLIHVYFDADVNPKLLPAWWYCIFYIYTAAIVLLASRLRPELEMDSSPYSITESWEYALNMLRSMEEFTPSAKRCITALEILESTISMAKEAENPHLGSQMLQLSSDEMADLTVRDDRYAESGASFGNFVFNPNDMSWLNSMPGTL